MVRFSLRTLILLVTASAVVVFLWPRSPRLGSPNLSGRVTDVNGKPIPNVHIRLYGGIATRWLSQESVTDQHGRYRFEPLHAGAILIFDEGQVPRALVGMQIEHATYCSVDGKSWWDESIPRLEGYEHRRDFVLQRGGAIAGRVMESATGRPCGQLRLRIVAKNADNTNYLRYAETDEDGYFYEAALPAGSYLVEVNRDGYRQLGRADVVADSTCDVTYTLEVSEHDTSESGENRRVQHEQ